MEQSFPSFPWNIVISCGLRVLSHGKNGNNGNFCSNHAEHFRYFCYFRGTLLYSSWLSFCPTEITEITEIFAPCGAFLLFLLFLWDFIILKQVESFVPRKERKGRKFLLQLCGAFLLFLLFPWDYKQSNHLFWIRAAASCRPRGPLGGGVAIREAGR